MVFGLIYISQSSSCRVNHASSARGALDGEHKFRRGPAIPPQVDGWEIDGDAAFEFNQSLAHLSHLHERGVCNFILENKQNAPEGGLTLQHPSITGRQSLIDIAFE